MTRRDLAKLRVLEDELLSLRAHAAAVSARADRIWLSSLYAYDPERPDTVAIERMADLALTAIAARIRAVETAIEAEEKQP